MTAYRRVVAAVEAADIPLHCIGLGTIEYFLNVEKRTVVEVCKILGVPAPKQELDPMEAFRYGTDH